jgi:3D-(3,5/4)-trihydroxycyclohexane-1,2-dione acylhydrolase (decyclizing)
LNIVLLDNHGFSSIGGLSRSCGNQGMGTNYRYRRGEKYDGDFLPVDFVANATSLGAWATRANSRSDLITALAEVRRQPRTSVVVVETSYEQRVPGYESWWDVAVAEISEREAVQAARKKYEQARQKERLFF